MKKVKNIFNNVLFSSLMLSIVSSCSLVSLPSLSSNKQTYGVTINNYNSQIEPLKREDYTILRTTIGKASTSKFYVLFFPIGRHKTNEELFNSAYYGAVDNLANADALLLPRHDIKKFTIPLLLVNYSKRTVSVSGVGISVKN